MLVGDTVYAMQVGRASLQVSSRLVGALSRRRKSSFDPPLQRCANQQGRLGRVSVSTKHQTKLQVPSPRAAESDVTQMGSAGLRVTRFQKRGNRSSLIRAPVVGPTESLQRAHCRL